MTMERSCTCVKCVRACRNTPGWFAPDQSTEGIDPALLIKDYRCPEKDGRPGVFVLRPRMVGEVGDNAAFALPKGTCVFLTAKERCAIYDRRPEECRSALACDPNIEETAHKVREAIGQEWRDAGSPLGNDVPDPSLGDMLEALFQTVEALSVEREDPKP